jgi:hypothetical protein
LSACRSDAVSAAPVGSGFPCLFSFLRGDLELTDRLAQSKRHDAAEKRDFGSADTSSNVAASVISPNKAGSVVTKLMAAMILQVLGRKRHLPGFSVGIENTSLLFRVGREIRGIHRTGEGGRGSPDLVSPPRLRYISPSVGGV